MLCPFSWRALWSTNKREALSCISWGRQGISLVLFYVAAGLMGKRKQLQFMLCRADGCGSLALPQTSEFIKGAAHRKEPLPPSLGIHEFGARKLEVELILEEAKLQITWFHVLFCLSPPLHHKIRTNQLCKMMFWEVGWAQRGWFCLFVLPHKGWAACVWIVAWTWKLAPVFVVWREVWDWGHYTGWFSTCHKSLRQAE